MRWLYSYEALASRNKNITLAGCLNHARRKFMEVVKMTNGIEGVATEVIKYIAALAKIEEEIKELAADEKYLIRQTKAKPILSNLHHYLTINQLSIPPKSLLGQAVSYTLN